MHPLTPLLLADILRDRQAEAERRALAAHARAGAPRRPSSIRRGLAITFLTISRATAAAVRRLDACLADDLAESVRVVRSA